MSNKKTKINSNIKFSILTYMKHLDLLAVNCVMMIVVVVVIVDVVVVGIVMTALSHYHYYDYDSSFFSLFLRRNKFFQMKKKHFPLH